MPIPPDGCVLLALAGAIALEWLANLTPAGAYNFGGRSSRSRWCWH
ncbi:hypothetical protein [Devosia sp. CAU 1758]